MEREDKIIVSVIVFIVTQLVVFIAYAFIVSKIERAGLESYRKGVKDSMEIMGAEAVEDL